LFSGFAKTRQQFRPLQSQWLHPGRGSKDAYWLHRTSVSSAIPFFAWGDNNAEVQFPEYQGSIGST